MLSRTNLVKLIVNFSALLLLLIGLTNSNSSVGFEPGASVHPTIPPTPAPLADATAEPASPALHPLAPPSPAHPLPTAVTSESNAPTFAATEPDTEPDLHPFSPPAPNLHPATPIQPNLIATKPAMVPPANTKHHPLETFRIDLAHNNDNLHPAGKSHKTKSLKSNHQTKTGKKTKSSTPEKCPACPTCPKNELELIAAASAMGAVIIQNPANGLKGHGHQALVVLIPFNAEQFAAVSEFTKWLDEQQPTDFNKLQTKITQKAQSLNLAGIRGVIVKKTELHDYMERNQVDFAAALRRFAEDLGHYERVTAKLSFDDLKNAVLRKLQAA